MADGREGEEEVQAALSGGAREIFPVRETDVAVAGAEGATLRGRLSTPQGWRAGGLAALVIHPWGWLGGSHHVAAPVARGLAASGEVLCLRLNARGVGDSTGWTTFSGSSGKELDDVAAAVAWLREEKQAGRVYVVGCSHGALVGAAALSRCGDPVAGYVSGAGALGTSGMSRFPIGIGCRLFFRSMVSKAFQATVPRLFVLGDSDVFTPVSTLRSFCKGAVEPRPEVRILPRVGHFELFMPGRENEAFVALVLNFIRRVEADAARPGGGSAPPP